MSNDPLLNIIIGILLFVVGVAAIGVALNQFIQAWVTWIKREHKGVDRPNQAWDEEPTYQVDNTQYTTYTEVPLAYYDELGIDPPPRNPRRKR